MKNSSDTSAIIEINGPIVKGSGLADAFLGEQVSVGKMKLPGEVIRASRDAAVIQVYEDTAGLMIGEEIVLSGHALSVELGPGLAGAIFDGLQRPLRAMSQDNPFIERGRSDIPLPRGRKWHFIPSMQKGSAIHSLDIIGTVKETEAFTHRIMIPRGIEGSLSFI
ncbi:MAG: V-type ATP synthase subunit A, partial [Spirochaetota bacterium]